MTYAEKLKDPKWQRKRLEILSRDSFTCQYCGNTETTLHVHHRTYSYGKDPWDYADTNFITLCEKCHEMEEGFKVQTNDLIHDLLLMGCPYEIIYLELQKLIEKFNG